MSSSEKLSVTFDNRIKRITFNRPERRNALDFEMFARFGDALRESASDGTRVIIITGAGDSFSAGLDLTSINPQEIGGLDVAAAVRELINPAILMMRRLPVPVIARVHGHAAGIGFSYALASDICIASDASLFSQSFIRVGLVPDGGSTYFLPQLVGSKRAYELMMSGEQIDAREAERLGLVNRVVTFTELDATVDALAARLAHAPALSLASIKAAITRTQEAALAAALDFEADAQHACFNSPDFLEGVTAFAQKRPPRFGRSSDPDA